MDSIDINCDMGEGMNNDSFIMPYISSANISCGYHAGDAEVIKNVLKLAHTHKVSIGAHVSFLDHENFGRKEIQLSSNEIYQLITDQLTIFDRYAEELGVKVNHVKPHGALYNMAARDKTIATSIANAISDFDRNLILYGLSKSYLIEEGERAGLSCCNEVFADRSYQDDGSLTSRSVEGALFETSDAVIRQVLQIVQEHSVTSINMKKVNVLADTVCIHGDGKNAVEFAKAIFTALKREKIEIVAPRRTA